MIRSIFWSVWVAAVVLGVIVAAQPARAGVLYATQVGSNAAHLYTVNQTTAALTDLGALHTASGSTPITWGTGLAFDNTGTLWGVDGMTGWVGTIDTSSALLTPVPAQAGTINYPGFIAGIAFHPVSNVLYAICESAYVQGAHRGLYTIDQATGVYSLVAAYDSVNMAGLAFGNDGYLYGVMYGTGQLYRIDPNNPSSLTVIGTAGTLRQIRDITGISDATGVSFFAETDYLSGSNGALAQIFLGSPNTFTAIGPLAPALAHIDGLAYLGDPAPAVPEPSSFALAAGLGGLALAFGWRRRG